MSLSGRLRCNSRLLVEFPIIYGKSRHGIISRHEPVSLISVLEANQPAQPSSKAAMFDDGHERGHLPTLFLTHKFNKNIDAFFQYEYFIPGNFMLTMRKTGSSYGGSSSSKFKRQKKKPDIRSKLIAG